MGPFASRAPHPCLPKRLHGRDKENRLSIATDRYSSLVGGTFIVMTRKRTEAIHTHEYKYYKYIHMSVQILPVSVLYLSS